MSVYRLILLVILMIVGSPAWAERDISGGIQRCHLKSVLHVSSDGRVLQSYNPTKSFIPLGVFTQWATRLDVIASGGFNTILLGIDKLALDEPVERVKLMDRCRSAGLRLIPGYVPQKDEALRALAKDPYLLMYSMMDEPNRFFGSKEDPIERVYTDVLATQKRVCEHDPGRVTWVNLVPRYAFENDMAQTGWWYAFNSVGEVASTDCYPVVSSESVIVDVARAVAEQIRINENRRPSFFFVQGHKDKRMPPALDNIYPTPEQYRCAIYTAIVHGAVGIMIFKMQEDSWKYHPGIGPDTVASTGTPEELAKLEREFNIITPADARRSRELWKQATQINSEITKLKEVILTPTADIPYHITLLDSKGGTGVDLPVRTLLKKVNGWFYLFTVNVDSSECKVRFDFPSKAGQIRDLSLLHSESPHPAARHNSIEDTLSPLAVKIYKFKMHRP